ncbi:MAG: hypothetical protein ACXAB4_10460, partial [Candidatus Hodarchaeales archaeon]
IPNTANLSPWCLSCRLKKSTSIQSEGDSSLASYPPNAEEDLHSGFEDEDAFLDYEVEMGLRKPQETTLRSCTWMDE